MLTGGEALGVADLAGGRSPEIARAAAVADVAIKPGKRKVRASASD